MDNKIFTKFNIYDQIGYLMVGGVGLIVLFLDLPLFYKVVLPGFTIDTFLIWFIVAYFLGHLIQGVANIINRIPVLDFLVKEDKTDFSCDEKEILDKAKTFFGLKEQDNNKLWNLCYTLSCAKGVTEQVQSFDAYYSIYRGWLIVFALESLFLLYLTIFYNLQLLLPFLLSTLFAFIFYQRSRKFWQYLRSKVLQTFMVVKILKQ